MTVSVLTSPGPPGTIPKSIVSVGDRFSHYGLVNLSQITTLDPSTLAKFDIEFPAACKTWISRAPFTVEEFCAELVAFLARYGINISNAEGYVKVARTTGVLSLGARVNFFVGANVANELVAAGCLTKGRIYWRTVLDILCFRGLQDDVAWP